MLEENPWRRACQPERRAASSPDPPRQPCSPSAPADKPAAERRAAASAAAGAARRRVTRARRRPLMAVLEEIAHRVALSALVAGEPPPADPGRWADGLPPATERVVAPLLRRYFGIHRRVPRWRFVVATRAAGLVPAALFWEDEAGNIEADLFAIGAAGAQTLGEDARRRAGRLATAGRERFGSRFLAVRVVQLQRGGETVYVQPRVGDRP